MTLSEYVKKTPVSTWLFWYITRECASGLFHLHKYGIMHRDVKPSNVLIIMCVFHNYFLFFPQNFIQRYRSGSGLPLVKLTDFGISKFVLGNNHTSNIGTTGFIAPEVKDVTGVYTELCDVYSLGMTLNFVLPKAANSLEIQEILQFIGEMTAIEPKLRPSIKDILDKARNALLPFEEAIDKLKRINSDLQRYERNIEDANERISELKATARSILDY